MEAINNIVGMLNGPIWGVGMLVLIVGSGLYFTIRLGFFQFVHFKDMWSRIIDKSESESGISSFASFCTTMAMRVGTGNVAGVAFTQRSCWNKCDFFIFNFFLYQTSYT